MKSNPLPFGGKKTSWGVYFGPSIPIPITPPGEATELDPDLEEPTQNEQDRMKMDCASKEFRERMSDPGRNRNGQEWISLIYRQNGRVYATQLRTMGGGGFTQTFIESLLTEFGITRADVLGFVHNHNSSDYCLGASDFQEANQLNRQPSDNDWDTRDWFIAGGASAREFTMYVMSCQGSGIYAYGPGMPRGVLGPQVPGSPCPEDNG